MTELSSGVFQHSKQFKFEEKYSSKYQKFFSGKSEQMFFPISDGHQHGVSILGSINLCETCCHLTQVRNTPHRTDTWTDSLYTYHLISLLHSWYGFDFFSMACQKSTVKTGNTVVI